MEDFETTHKLIAMFPVHYRKLLEKGMDGYILKLEDFDNVKITEENLADFQALLYDEYGNEFYEEDDYE